NRFRYIGKLGYYLEPALGCYYVRRRYYVHWLGRFLSKDPIRRGGENAYGYVNNRPTRGTDPSGRFVIIEVLIVIAGVAVVVAFVVNYPGPGSSGVCERPPRDKYCETTKAYPHGETGGPNYRCDCEWQCGERPDPKPETVDCSAFVLPDCGFCCAANAPIDKPIPPPSIWPR
ncbi:MAG: RHS repeat-associated core domain-containing protein, partial [Armatimonadetes bacterium]|nr:RHS repeat-associated core domain-containing protein [Armatimonadota bacterium]